MTSSRPPCDAAPLTTTMFRWPMKPTLMLKLDMGLVLRVGVNHYGEVGYHGDVRLGVCVPW